MPTNQDPELPATLAPMPDKTKARIAEAESKPLSSSDLTARIRDLIVYLHRANETKAEVIVVDVAGHLKEIMRSGGDPSSFEMQRAQQTMFAIDEVLIMLGQRDFEGAATAARDAVKEWKRQPPPGATPD